MCLYVIFLARTSMLQYFSPSWVTVPMSRHCNVDILISVLGGNVSVTWAVYSLQHWWKIIHVHKKITGETQTDIFGWRRNTKRNLIQLKSCVKKWNGLGNIQTCTTFVYGYMVTTGSSSFLFLHTGCWSSDNCSFSVTHFIPSPLHNS